MEFRPIKYLKGMPIDKFWRKSAIIIGMTCVAGLLLSVFTKNVTGAVIFMTVGIATLLISME